MSTQTSVTAGASLAGAEAAEDLRERGFNGRVVGSEDQRPYERPPLEEGVSAGDAEREKLFVHRALECAARGCGVDGAHGRSSVSSIWWPH